MVGEGMIPDMIFLSDSIDRFRATVHGAPRRTSLTWDQKFGGVRMENAPWRVRAPWSFDLSASKV